MHNWHTSGTIQTLLEAEAVVAAADIDSGQASSRTSMTYEGVFEMILSSVLPGGTIIREGRLAARQARSRLLRSYIAEPRYKTRMFGLRQIPERVEPGRREHLEILDAFEAARAAPGVLGTLVHSRRA